ncbi:MAG: hypothetical protein NTV56_13690, partial [Alphaproteobacteria bacterium]|nr:hypothetical protein [Alphaproteobacteria bacterium]
EGLGQIIQRIDHDRDVRRGEQRRDPPGLGAADYDRVQLLALREEIGDFGEIVYAGMDWADPALAKRSLQLMAEQVLPRVNAAIGKSAAA